MTYAVHHVDAADSPQLEEFPSLEAGLARVEALRNDGEVSEVRVFKEIPIEVRTYYRVVAVEDAAVDGVTVPAGEDAAPATPPEPADPGAGEPVAAASVPEVGNGHRPATTDAPSGSVVMTPPPVAPAAEAAEPVAAESEHRGRLFGRG